MEYGFIFILFLLELLVEELELKFVFKFNSVKIYINCRERKK